MNWLILGVVSGAVVCYLAWRASPPRDVIGSYLTGFNSSSRKLKMIKDEADQDYNLFNR